MTKLSGQLPPFDPTTTKPNATINEPERSPMLPTWLPDAPNKDAQLAVIHPAEINGEYTRAHNAGNPHMQEAIGSPGYWESERIHTAGADGETRRYPYLED